MIFRWVVGVETGGVGGETADIKTDGRRLGLTIA